VSHDTSDEKIIQICTYPKHNVLLQHWMCNAVITIAIRLRYDYDPTATYRARHAASIRRDSTRAKNEHVNFSS